MTHQKRCHLALVAGLAAGALTLSACSAGSLGSSGESGGAQAANVEITLFTDNQDSNVKSTNAVISAFNATNQGVTVKIETRPDGNEGDNIVKTRLATGEMTDLLYFNSGALLQAVNPADTLVPLTNEPFMANVQEGFKPAVTFKDEVYGVPFGTAMGGGILYNKKVYADLGLQTPKTWAEFMANNVEIKKAGIDPVLQSYADDWTNQLLVLADFHNVSAVDPQWADKYTANKAKYVDEPAIKGFQRLEEIYKAGYSNKDYVSITQSQALDKLVKGEGAHYPMLTAAVPAYVDLADDAAENIGFFAQPGDDASTYGLTAWAANAIYIPVTTTGEKLEASKKFLAWLATPAACDAQTEGSEPTGAYQIVGCELPDGLPAAINDLQKYLDDGNYSMALEFLSPVKGMGITQILTEVGTGMITAAEGAARYDEDVKKQAQQLGLEGW